MRGANAELLGPKVSNKKGKGHASRSPSAVRTESLSRSLCALCAVLCALCSVLCALCSVLRAPCSVLRAPCSVLSAQCSVLRPPCSALLALRPSYSVLRLCAFCALGRRPCFLEYCLLRLQSPSVSRDYPEEEVEMAEETKEMCAPIPIYPR